MKEIQLLIARHKPLPPVPSTIRKLPDPKPPVAAAAQTATANVPTPARLSPDAHVPPSPARRTIIVPLSEATYKLQFTIRKDAHDKLRRLQSLLRHQIPKGDAGLIFERAMDALLADVLKRKSGAVERPRRREVMCSNLSSRHVLAHIRRAVWTRDGGACAFTASGGRRCGEEGRLEYHHVVPYAAGGKTTLENIELRCRAHNRYEAEEYFGRDMMALFKETAPLYASACG